MTAADVNVTRVHTRYVWDCPECGEEADEGDIEPQGEGKCDYCGERVRFE